MALTATPQSALSLNHDPAWDESIVPALRKRLENESHALSKRMSAASIVSSSDTHHVYPSQLQSYRDTASTPTNISPRPSAIPRPSLQHNRPAEGQIGNGRSSAASGKFQRGRTYSQPFPFDQFANGGSASQPIPELPSRSGSPMVSNAGVKSRIPAPRARAGSSASSKHLNSGGGVNGAGNGYAPRARTDSRAGVNKGTANFYTSANDQMPDLYPLSEVASSITSRSTIRTPRSQASQLVDEPPPFSNFNSTSSRWGGGYDSIQARTAGGVYANGRAYDEFAAPRMSTDSEERPFEHWYRGDVSRNGGVGELRVVKKQEMLDIANYGHSIRQEPSRSALGTNSRSRSNSRGREAGGMWAGHRPRSGSVGARPGRESILFDEDEMRKSRMMFDEQPPTDIDSDSEGHGGDQYSEYVDESFDANYHTRESTLLSREPLPQDEDDSLFQEDLRHASASPPLSIARSDTPTTLVDASKSSYKSRIPTPTPRQISESASSRTYSTSIDRERDTDRSTVGRTTPTPQSPVIAPQDSLPRPSISSARSLKSTQPPLKIQTQPQPKSPASTPKSPGSKTPMQATPSPGPAGANKRRAKSPASPIKPAHKKTRTKSSASKPSPMKKDDSGSKIKVEYSAGVLGEDGDMANAIPVWTQPVTPSGNWDDVVIPVVARKQGLENHFEHADGSPKPRPPPPTVIAPAPGTFGYDWTKSRRSAALGDVELDDFGQRIEKTPIAEPELIAQDSTSPTPSPDESPCPSPKPQVTVKPPQQSPSPPSPRSPGSQKRAESPAPFSHYTASQPVPLPQIHVTRPSGEASVEVRMEKEESGGCCKCVIM